MKKLTVCLVLAILLSAFVLVGVASADEPPVWRTLVQPHAAPPGDDLDLDATRAAKTWADWRAHHTGPNPRAYQRLMVNEAKALRRGVSPMAAGLTAITGTEKLLVFLIEFNPDANDEFVDFVAPDYEGNCVTVTHTFNGPVHGEMPRPGDRDNNTLWLTEFPISYYEDLIFSTEGLGEVTLREGAAGEERVDLTGLTLVNYYKENSRGTLEITGTVVPTWFTLPHSEAWYAAAACAEGRTGMSGHPDNEQGVQQAVIDAVDAFNAISQTLIPGFDWNDYDVDSNGILDHLVVIKAGPGAEAGSFVTDTFKVWAHSSDVMPAQGGYTATAGVMVMNYTMQPENVEIGVLAHEFGHDLGLPDYYDTSGSGTSDVVWWDIMSTGSHSGPGAIGTMPTHFSSWNKFVFGWIDPLMLDTTSPDTDVTIGQVSNPPDGAEDAVFVMLPDQVAEIRAPHSGSKVWWSNFDVAWGDARLAHDVDLSGASGTITMSYWLNYAIEPDWDFLFIEASDDGGTTWTELQAWDATTGITVTTPDDYEDPNGRMVDYGNKKYGISGDTHGEWVQLYSDLSAYAGSDIDIRFRYVTDAGFQMDGASLDDVEVLAIGWSDDMEGDTSGWVLDVSSFAGAAPGEGWKLLTDGKESFYHYYIAEWRNYDGFDEGLKYTYQTWLYDDDDEWAVNKIQANAPGMLVWYRNNRYKDNHMTSHLWDAPSTAPKGQLLIVDSHYNPYIRPEDNGLYALNTLPGRPQSTDVTFNLWGSHEFDLNAPITIDNPDDPITTTTYPARAAVPAFHDGKGYWPGWRVIDPAIWRRSYIDYDASVCVPSVDNQVYSTRIVERSGSAPDSFIYTPYIDWYGEDWYGDGLTILGSGNPVDDGVQFGVNIAVLNVATDNVAATIRVWNAPAVFEIDLAVDKSEAYVGDELLYSLTVTNVGPLTDTFELFLPILDALSDSMGGAYTATATLAPDATWSDSFSVTVNEQAYNGDLTSTVWELNGLAANTSATTTIKATNLTNSSKNVDKDTVTPGQSLTYTLVAINTGTISATVAVQDNLPRSDYVSFVEESLQATVGTPTYEPTHNDGYGMVHWDGTLEAGTAVTITYSLAVSSTAPSGTVFSNTVAFKDSIHADTTAVAETKVRYFIYLPIILKSYPPTAAVKIIYIEYAPAEELDEYVEITNQGSAEADMTNWTLSDAANPPYTHIYPFLTFTLAPGTTVKVWTKGGTDTATDLYWGEANGVWNNTGGDTATLKDASEQVVDTYSY